MTMRDDEPAPAARYTGALKAFVRDVADPLKQGRVRVFCPGVMGNVDRADHWLDWAMPKVPLPGDPSGAGAYGSVVVPDVGTAVWIEFEGGNPDFPVYSGGWIQGAREDSSSVPRLGRGQDQTATEGEDRTANGVTVPKSTAGTPTYPANRILQTKAGHLIELDDTTGRRRIRLRHASGSFSEWTEPGGLIKQILGDFLLWAGAAVKIAAVSDLLLTGASVVLGSATATRTVVTSDLVAVYNAHTHPETGGTTGVPTVPLTGGVTSATIKVP